MNVEVAQRLAARRKQAGLSQEALAEKLGVSRQAVSKWERSESSPDTDNLIALAQLYGVSLDELLYVDKETREDMEFAASDKAREEKTATSQEDNSSAKEGTRNAKADSNENEAEVGSNASSATTQGGENRSPNDNATEAEANDNATEPKADNSQEKKKEAPKVNIGFGGVHVEDDDSIVHVSWSEGIHVIDGKKGEEVHVGWDGIHVDDGRNKVDGAFGGEAANEGVFINGEHYESWLDAHEALDNKNNEHASFKRIWNRFPYPLVIIIVYLLMGFMLGSWGPSLFLFLTIPVYYMIGHAVSNRRIAPLLSGVYPIAVVAFFCYEAFMLNAPHPAWVAFLTIPLVEWLLHSLSKWWRHRKREREALKDSPIDVEPHTGSE